MITRIKIEGFKSIEHCDINMRSLNVLIGPNGAGKSNFVSLFKMMQRMFDKELQSFISYNGGPDALLFNGRKSTSKLNIETYWGSNGYHFTLEPTVDNRMVFARECFYWDRSGAYPIGSGHYESLFDKGTRTGIDRYVVPEIRKWKVFHFHDTSDSSLMKQMHNLNDNISLSSDARNLAPFLLLLREKYRPSYDDIIEAIRRVAPFFGEFVLREDPYAKGKIQLEWKSRGTDIVFNASQLSDGTLRFICLATLLLQPSVFRARTIVIDEPELGLHPFAIKDLAALLKKASGGSQQIIISTQSVDLLNEFDPENIIVVERENNATILRTVDNEQLKQWLDNDYSLGELWNKNLLGGRPKR